MEIYLKEYSSSFYFTLVVDKHFATFFFSLFVHVNLSWVLYFRRPTNAMNRIDYTIIKKR